MARFGLLVGIWGGVLLLGAGSLGRVAWGGEGARGSHHRDSADEKKKKKSSRKASLERKVDRALKLGRINKKLENLRSKQDSADAQVKCVKAPCVASTSSSKENENSEKPKRTSAPCSDAAAGKKLDPALWDSASQLFSTSNVLVTWTADVEARLKAEAQESAERVKERLDARARPKTQSAVVATNGDAANADSASPASSSTSETKPSKRELKETQLKELGIAASSGVSLSTAYNLKTGKGSMKVKGRALCSLAASASVQKIEAAPAPDLSHLKANSLK